MSLAKLLWGFSINPMQPIVLSKDGIIAIEGNVDDVRDFFASEFPSLTEEGMGTYVGDFVSQAKRTYITTMCDIIKIVHNDKIVGLFIGEPEDWSSYYIRTFASNM